MSWCFQHLGGLMNVNGWSHSARLAATAVFLVACGADFLTDEQCLEWNKIININGLRKNNCYKFRELLIEKQKQTVDLHFFWFVFNSISMSYFFFLVIRSVLLREMTMLRLKNDTLNGRDPHCPPPWLVMWHQEQARDTDHK